MSGIGGNSGALNVNEMISLLSKSYIRLIETGTEFSKFPSVMLWGPPGVGKSQGVRKIAENIKISTGKNVVVTDVRSVEDILSIIPYGGGGTDFTVIYDYVRNNYRDVYPSCIIIFTDGYGPYPEKEYTLNIPTLWILDNDEITPPFGKTVRLINEYNQ